MNFLAFLPGGVLASRFLGGRRAVLAAVIGSIVLEFLQMGVPGRHPSLSDVVFNGTGALAGVLITRRRVTHKIHTVLALMASLAWLSPIVMLRPVSPKDPLYGQWRPVMGGMGSFDGGVLNASLDGLPIPSWELEDPSVSEALRAHADLELRVELGTPPQELAPIFAIAEGRGPRVLVVAAHGADLAMWRRAVASVLRFEQPFSWSQGALADRVRGDSVHIAVVRTQRALCVSVEGDRDCGVAPGLQRGWQLLYGHRLPAGPGLFVLSVTWCVVVGGLVGSGCPTRVGALAWSSALAGIGLVLASWSPDVGPHAPWALLLPTGSLVGASLRLGALDLLLRAR